MNVNVNYKPKNKFVSETGAAIAPIPGYGKSVFEEKDPPSPPDPPFDPPPPPESLKLPPPPAFPGDPRALSNPDGYVDPRTWLGYLLSADEVDNSDEYLDQNLSINETSLYSLLYNL